MSTPGSTQNSFLVIGGDPTSWVLADPQPVPPSWAGSGDPVALPVNLPLAGTLVLSPRNAGSTVLVQPPPAGWIPCQITIAHIYVPTTGGVTATQPGYPLAAGTDLQTLQQDIMNAMSLNTFLTVGITGYGASPGVIVLNGAVLPFAVLCPPNA